MSKEAVSDTELCNVLQTYVHMCIVWMCRTHLRQLRISSACMLILQCIHAGDVYVMCMFVHVGCRR